MKNFSLVAASPFLAVAIVALLSGCNTIQGAGKDIESTGEAIEEAADND